MERPENSVDLFDYIREKGKINEHEAKIIFKQVIGAVAHIHSSGVVHRDIKDENIVLNRETGAIKIIDFGCGTLLKASPYRDFSGTPQFLSARVVQEAILLCPVIITIHFSTYKRISC